MSELPERLNLKLMFRQNKSNQIFSYRSFQVLTFQFSYVCFIRTIDGKTATIEIFYHNAY